MRSFSGAGKPTNVFAHATAMSNHYQSVNVGQGFPALPVETYVKDFVRDYINTNKNQYTRPGVTLELIKNLAEMYLKFLHENIHPL